MKLAELAEHFNGEITGDPSIDITSVCPIENGVNGGIAFLADLRYKSHLAETKASAVFVNKNLENIESSASIVRVDNPYVAYVQTVKFFYSLPKPFYGIDKRAIIDPSASIGENAAIAPFVYIGKNVQIGKNALIYPNTVIMDDTIIGDDARIYANVSIREETKIGDRVTIHSNATIGADGFGFMPNPPHGFEKVYQTAAVTLGNDVEVGANTCIDRGAISDTFVDDGTKLDNLVQIAHAVRVGKHNVMAAYTGLSGSTTVGDWNQFGGKAATGGHLKIGNQNAVSAGAMVINSVGDKTVVMGNPHREAMTFKRIQAAQTRLPDLLKDFRALKKEVEQLKKEMLK